MKSDGSPIYSQANTFDSTGNILQKTTEAGDASYTYDKIYQLTDADHPTISDEQFTYDPVGNRLVSADYNDWSYNNRNELGSYDGVTFTFDHNGNTVTRTDASGTTDYQYNYVNRLVRVDCPGGGYTTYKYDIRGRRIEKSVDGVVTRYLYDGNTLLAEYDASGSLNRNYFYGTGDANPSILVDDGQIYFYVKDHLDTPKKVVDESGDINWSAEYKSFGEISVSVNTVTNNFRFPGQYWDSETGLHYNWHRYYDAGIGRYMREDPIGLAGGINQYTYVNNNPVNKIDYTGLRVQICTRPVQNAIFGIYAKHCDIRITTKSNWGFFCDNCGFSGPGRVDENPSNMGTVCRDAIGEGNDIDCWDKCVHDAAEASQASNNGGQFHLPTHNCCHWSHAILASCGLKFPFPNINWPCNPGS